MTRDEIKSARKLRKLSQAALGKLTNLSGSEISRIECGYRDLSEIEAEAIAAALGGSRKPEPAAVPEPPKLAPVGMSRSKTLHSETPPAPPKTSGLVPAAASPAPVPSVPTGTDLGNPANFGVLPDMTLLAADAVDDAAFRARLAAEVASANKILHTPRVPAAVWRAWRQFEQQATERLRRGAPAPSSPAMVPEALVTPAVPQAAEPAIEAPEAAASSEGKGESKSFNSLFVEAARAHLPADQVERINLAAEAARKEDASIGFMKHFRRIAEAGLDADLLKQVTDEANQRLASPDRWRTRRGRGRSSSAAVGQ